jgi:hypothetical protein
MYILFFCTKVFWYDELEVLHRLYTLTVQAFGKFAAQAVNKLRFFYILTPPGRAIPTK